MTNRNKKHPSIPAASIDPKLFQEPKFLLIGVIGLAVVLLVFSSGKAFNIDDPLFIWTARQILHHPFDFYGFAVNWYTSPMPMAEVTKNPPLASFFAAPVIALFGDSEIALHLAFLLPLVILILGEYRLAGKFCPRPLLATAAMVWTPVFLVSGATIMCDILMLCFWVWAVVFWIEGVEGVHYGYLAAAAAAIAGSALSKYFGLSLLPLLFAYTLVRRRAAGSRQRAGAAQAQASPFKVSLALLLPAGVLWGYNILTRRLYGHGLLTEAVSYAQTFQPFVNGGPVLKGIIGLSFAGGCLISVLFFLPVLRSKLLPVTFGAVFLTAAALLSASDGAGIIAPDTGHGSLGVILQMSIFIAAAGAVIHLAILDAIHYRDHGSWLLLPWIAGTFAFACFFNWSVNGRSMLPLAPALGILIARRIATEKDLSRCSRYALLPLLPAAAISLLVVWADVTFANSQRSAAELFVRNYADRRDHVSFEGHWGFQYYLQRSGLQPVPVVTDARGSRLNVQQGDLLIEPSNNANVGFVPSSLTEPVRTVTFIACPFLATMNRAAGAGFYAHQCGPLPFAFGKVPQEAYTVKMFK